MLHVYGVIDDSQVLGAVPCGHGGAELAALSRGGLTAVVSDTDGADMEASVERVWHHEKILSALMERHAVVPMRFGMVCTADQLSTVLAQRQEALSAALKKLGGKVEMAVRVTDINMLGTDEKHNRQKDCPAPPSGRAYLLELVERRRRMFPENEPASRLVNDVKDRLIQLSIEANWHGPEAHGQPFKASCLIPREKVEAFVDNIEAFERLQPNLQVSCTGPWAPYSFVDRRAALGVAG